MYFNRILQIRISDELLAYCHTKPNVSRYLRSLIRYERMRRSSKKKTATNLFPEIRAKSPYTFFAELVRVVDGDTIVLNADLGFYIKAQIKIRLADIDVPPINTKKGQAVKEGIEKMLSKNNLVVESRKRDKYGRYLAYIYYHRKYTRFEDILRHGRILNRQLLKYGLAKVYEK